MCYMKGGDSMIKIKKDELTRLVNNLREKGLAVYNSISKFQGDPYTRGSWLHSYIQDQLYRVLGTPDQVQIIG